MRQPLCSQDGLANEINDPEALATSRWPQIQSLVTHSIVFHLIFNLKDTRFFYPRKLPFPDRVLVDHTVEDRYVSLS
jgi:hypothetical protein